MKSNKPLAPAAQASPPSSKEKSFANETPEQQARHREIAHRYRRSRRGGATRRLIANLRKAELQRIFFDRCGETLPDDDAGREYLRLMADHLAQLGANYITAYGRASAPWVVDGRRRG